VYSVKKFPNDARDDWIAENKSLVEEQVQKFEGSFDEALKTAFEQTMAEHLFLSNAMEEVVEWKQNFARFLSYSIDAAETQIKQDKGKEAFLRGRLSMIKEILDWF
jgi:DNA repair exonuclease SbcCD ATPase subunit